MAPLSFTIGRGNVGLRACLLSVSMHSVDGAVTCVGCHGYEVLVETGKDYKTGKRFVQLYGVANNEIRGAFSYLQKRPKAISAILL